MEARQPRGLLELAYAQPQVLPRRTKPSETPGWLFDATVVCTLLILAVGYFTA